MALESPSRAALEFVAQAARAYSALIASRFAAAESGLGGRLLYAGELNKACRALVVAANVAGAATLVATADRTAQKQALRDGIVDFPVNSLEEALRILKNQLRKRETVAVCIALEPAAVESEMNERGVAPDLLRRDVSVAYLHPALTHQKSEQHETELSAIPALVTWRVESGSPQELATLDEIALQCLDAGEWAAHRWLRLSPRYLGRLAHGLHALSTHPDFAARFSQQLKARADRGGLAFVYEVRTFVLVP